MRIGPHDLSGFPEADAIVKWETREVRPDVTMWWPRYAPGTARRMYARLVAAAETVRSWPTARVVECIDAAAARLVSGPLRASADEHLPLMTGYSPAMVRVVLDRMIEDWRAPALERLLAGIGGAEALDSFVLRSHGLRSRAFGPRFAVHIAAGNVPGVAVSSVIRTLLLRSPTLVKPASGEPVLAGLFGMALNEVSPELAALLGVVYWPGGEDPFEDEILSLADVVLFHGGAPAAAALRAKLSPHTRFVQHGPKVSFGLIGSDVLHEAAGAVRVAREAALAVALFDQQGCVSPHMLYVESGGEVGPDRFAALLAAELEALHETLPRGSITEAESAAILEARAAAEFASDAVVHAGRGTRSTVIFERDPSFRASCLNRLVYVKPVGRLEDVPGLVEPFHDVLQTAALSGASDRLDALAAALGRAGVTRIASFAEAPWPPVHGHHDGMPPLGELVRWVDIEG